MRLESKVKYAELAPAHNWRFKDSGNFGGRSLLTPDQDTLAHYGVPGMRWGVKTKEYVKKGYDTLKRRQAILKMKRKAEAKAQYDEGYHRGQRVASNTHFIKNRVNPILARKQELEHPKERFSDRAVDKVTDFALKKTGLDKEIKKHRLDPYLPMAKDFLKQMKDYKVDEIYEDLKTEEGRDRLIRVVNFMTSGLYYRGQHISQLARQGGRAIGKAVGKAVIKSASNAAKELGASARNKYKELRSIGVKNLARSAGDQAFNKFMGFLSKKRKRS